MEIHRYSDGKGCCATVGAVSHTPASTRVCVHTHNRKSMLICAHHERIMNACISDLPVSALDREAEHLGVGVGDGGLGVQGAADGRHWPLHELRNS